MKDLKDKVVVITGASKGLGKALAFGFSAHGSKLALCARNQNSLSTVVKEIESIAGEVYYLPIDISKPSQVEKFVDGIYAQFGKIDVLINNASVLGPRVEVIDYPYTDWQQVIDVNLTGMFLITKKIIKHMIDENAGSIINVSSGVGAIGKPRWGAYLVSKFGLEGFSYMLAEEVIDTNIRVNVVNPGAMATEMRRHAYPEEDQSKLKKPEDIVEVFYYLASDQSAGVTGKRFNAQEFTVPTLS